MMSNQTKFTNESVYETLCDICDKVADATDPIMQLAMNMKFDGEEDPYNWRKEVVVTCYDYEQKIAAELLRLARFCYDRTEFNMRLEDFQDIAAATLGTAQVLYELQKYVKSKSAELAEINKTSKRGFKDILIMLDSVVNEYDKPYEDLLVLSADLSEYAYPDL